MCSVGVSNACDTFILTIVNHKRNETPKFKDNKWTLLELGETEVSASYLNATKIFMVEVHFTDRLLYILKNMWPVECTDCWVVAIHDDDYMRIQAVKP